MPKIQRYAPDTNFYLHAKAVSQIPWSEVTDADTIELIVLDEVLVELDRHKANGNGRRSRRARDIFTTLDPLIDDDEQEIEARKAKPRVLWRLAPVLVADRIKPAGLDLTSVDGRIVEQAFAVSEVLGGNLALLTHDRLPRRLAKTVGLDRQRVPDGWLLPPEPDERDKQNAKLKEELNSYKSRAPAMEIGLFDGDEPLVKIDRSVVRYRPLSEQFIAETLQSIEYRYPAETAFQAGQINIVNQSAVTDYRTARSQWIGKVKELLERQPRGLTFAHGVVNLELIVTNVGSVPAEGLVVDIWIEGGVKLINHRMRDQYFSGPYRVTSPEPPKMKRYAQLGSAMGNFDMHDRARMLGGLQSMPQKRDPAEFYWDYDDDEMSGSRVTGTCGEFRHQVSEIILPIVLFVPHDEERDAGGCLRVRCSAKNLPKPVEWKYPIRLQLDWMESEEVVHQLILGSPAVGG